MDTPPPHDQFREIARINQQPIYFPNALGMERLKWVWGILAAIVLFIVLATWTVAGRFGELTTNTKDMGMVKAELAGTSTKATDNQREINSRKESFDKMLIFYGNLQMYDFKLWWEQHRTMWEMKVRGESNKESFFREHGYPAPGQPEK